MHIVFVAPECAPCVKTGGLGEVLGALPAAIASLGHRITMFVPYYRTVRLAMETQPDATVPSVVLESVTIPFPERNRFVRVLDGGNHGGVQTYLIDCPEFFDREDVYGPPGENYPDNALRFGLYCRAVLEACKLLGVPDVFHLHDWQASFVSILLHTTYAADPLLRDAATVFTIHNGGYQGMFPPGQLRDLLLPAALFTGGALATDSKVNPFLGALRNSDAVTAVSPSYAEELKTPEYGEGLEKVYRERGDAFSGILNGIDADEWNSAIDPHLAAHYSANDLEGKQECRRDLLHAFDADGTADHTAVVGMVSRLAAQKGFDLIAGAMSELAELDLLLLIVGRGEPELEESFRELAEIYPKHLRVSPEFHETLAHKVQAGADMTLMPSRYEPSGLTQMYSLRYGTVPIVRATGGLRDTVQDGEDGNGFAFTEYTSDALVTTVKRALAEFADTANWQERMRRGMRADLSWKRAAAEYVAVYERAVAAHAAGQSAGRG
ncbi:glycogen synthase [Terriglobus sp.]|uniref:glycogen synthase n=1 Tax=Terriglobus sp. TaxID=1889013 RepID=UPI003AFFC39D